MQWGWTCAPISIPSIVLVLNYAIFLNTTLNSPLTQ